MKPLATDKSDSEQAVATDKVTSLRPVDEPRKHAAMIGKIVEHDAERGLISEDNDVEEGGTAGVC